MTQNIIHLTDLEELASEFVAWSCGPYCGYPDDPWPTALMMTNTESELYETCRREGHDLIDEGYAGPDSGAIDMTCVRCGYSYHHQLY